MLNLFAVQFLLSFDCGDLSVSDHKVEFSHFCLHLEEFSKNQTQFF